MGESQALRVVLAEDEVIIRKDLVAILERLGLVVEADVATGVEAIEAARRCAPDLLVLDVRLSGALDGIAVAEQVQEFSDAMIIFVSAFDQETQARGSRLRHVLGHLRKPLVASTVGRLLERHGLIAR